MIGSSKPLGGAWHAAPARRPHRFSAEWCVRPTPLTHTAGLGGNIRIPQLQSQACPRDSRKRVLNGRGGGGIAGMCTPQQHAPGVVRTLWTGSLGHRRALTQSLNTIFCRAAGDKKCSCEASIGQRWRCNACVVCIIDRRIILGGGAYGMVWGAQTGIHWSHHFAVLVLLTNNGTGAQRHQTTGEMGPLWLLHIAFRNVCVMRVQ